MNFNYTDRITEAPKFDASNMPRRDEWTDELAFSAVVWLNDCRVWMYRGAWAEWPVEDIEMCVPMSPEELMHKRKSILKHSSQMESAPYLGNDSRLFWQRAEDRNRATSRLYDALGLASYEAMEAFREYHI
jgi:glucosamine-6-phosphate deaminase